MIRKKAFFLFGTVCIGMLVFHLVFLNQWVRFATEKVLEHVLKTEVSIESARVQWKPFGLTLHHVRVVDPSEIDRYQFESDRVSLQLQFRQLLQKRLIIESVEALGIQQDTPRPGVVVDIKTDESVQDETDMSSDEDVSEIVSEGNSAVSAEPSRVSSSSSSSQVDVDALVASAQLDTRDHATVLRQQFKEDQQQLASLVSLDENQSELDGLKEKFDQLKKKIEQNELSDFAQFKEECDALLVEAKAVKSGISDRKQQVAAIMARQKKGISQLKQMGRQDMDALKQTFKKDTYTSGSFTDTLLNDDLARELEAAFSYVKLAQRVLGSLNDDSVDDDASSEARKGTYFDFGSSQTLPRLWVKSFRFSSESPNFSGEILHLSSNQALTGVPVSVTYEDAHVTVFGRLDTRQESIMQYYDYQRRPYALSPRVLYQGGDDFVQLESATQTVTAQVVFEGLSLSGDISLETSDIYVEPLSSKALSFSRLLVNTLTSKDVFVAQCQLSGSLRAPKLRISSDLDEALKAGFEKTLRDEQARYEKQLQEAIQRVVKQEQASLLSDVGDSESRSAEVLDDQQAQADALVQAIDDEESKIDKHIQTLKDEAKKALKAQQKEAQKQLQKEAEKLLNNLF